MKGHSRLRDQTQDQHSLLEILNFKGSRPTLLVGPSSSTWIHRGILHKYAEIVSEGYENREMENDE